MKNFARYLQCFLSVGYFWLFKDVFLFFMVAKSILFLPTTLSSKTWLIFGFVETWHSKVPASVALVNFNLRVFWPRLQQHLTFYHAFSFTAAIRENNQLLCDQYPFYMLKTVKSVKQILMLNTHVVKTLFLFNIMQNRKANIFNSIFYKL